MRILVDMDGVMADFDGEFLKRWRERYPDALYIPEEERTTFKTINQYPKELRPQALQIILEPGFFRDMMPVEGARDAIFEMERINPDIFICTSPLSTYKNCVLEKYEWVEKNLGVDWVHRIVLTNDKTLVRADILIDDKPEVTGVEEKPNWEHILYDRPYNRHVNKRRLTWANWREVLDL